MLEVVNTDQTLEEYVTAKELEKIKNPDIWSDVYVKYNAKIAERDETGAYPIYYDKLAIKILEMQIEKAYLNFPSKKIRMKFMIDNGFYKKDLLRGGITLDDVESLYEAYESGDIGEATYYGLYQFVNAQGYKVTEKAFKEIPDDTYELPTARFDDKYILLETRADRVVSVVLDSLASRGLKVVKRKIKMLAKREAHPSTPTYTNGGLADAGQLTSCFILKFQDTIESIADLNTYTLLLSKMGGGLGYDGSDLRALGEMVKKAENRTHGVVPIAKMLEQKLRFADQDGKRQGSGAFYLDIHHPDVFRLLDAKKENTDESVRLSDLSIGLIFNDKFMSLMDKQEGYYTFYPHTVFVEYGIKLSDMNMTEMYDELVANPRVRKDFYEYEFVKDTLGAVASESGYPYICFRETMNEEHVFKNAKIYSSNLCTEILQRQDEVEVKLENGDKITVQNGVQCTLESGNVDKMMKNNSIKETIELMTEHLTGALFRTDFHAITPVHRAKLAYRAIGIGFANYQGYLASVGIPYESDYSIDFARVFFSTVNYHSIEASMNLVPVYGVFDEFEDTTYADGTYFNKYLTNDYTPTTEKVASLFEGHFIPTKKDWENLKQKVMKNGLANAYRIAIAPTGSISYSMGATASVMANTQIIENRKTGSSSSAFYPMPYLSPKTFFMYKDAYRVDDFKYFDLIATIQEHVDQGISTTLFITDDYSTSDWWARIIYGWKVGLKTIYYVRPKISSYEECQSCQ